MHPLTNAGIWCVMMKAAASFSNLSCSSIDSLSESGKEIPKTQKACHTLLMEKLYFVCVCEWVVSHATWREDVWVETHLKQDVANRAYFFASSPYSISGSRVTCNNHNISQVRYEQRFARVNCIFCVPQSKSFINLLTSCCTFFESPILIQYLLDTLSELTMSEGSKSKLCERKSK